MRRIPRAMPALAALLFTVAACTNGADDTQSGGADSNNEVASGNNGDREDITFIVYAGPEVEFFVPVVNGAKEAAEQLGANLDVQYASEDNAKQNNLIELATNRADGIAVSIQDSEAFTDTICQAHEKGIPVVSFNVDASEGPVLDCRLAFMGQGFEETGYLIGQRMIEEHGIGDGDTVFAPVEVPEAVYAVQRAAGLQQALEEVGATADVVGTGFNLSDVQTTEVQYLLGHPDTAAIIALGSSPLTVAPAASEEAAMDLPIGGFDLTEDIIAAIQDGEITATVDQQPFSQGYYAVTQLVLNLRYGLYPSGMNTGGSGLVDESNVDVVAELVGDIR